MSGGPRHHLGRLFLLCMGWGRHHFRHERIMSAETLDQAAREGTLGVRPEVGLCSKTGNNGESLRKKGGYPTTLAKSGPACSLEHGPRKEPVVGMQVPCVCLDPGSRRLASLPGVITGLGSISIQNSHPSLSWCQI